MHGRGVFKRCDKSFMQLMKGVSTNGTIDMMNHYRKQHPGQYTALMESSGLSRMMMRMRTTMRIGMRETMRTRMRMKPRSLRQTTKLRLKGRANRR